MYNKAECASRCWVPKDLITDIDATVAFVILLQGLTALAISSCVVVRVMNAFRNLSLAVYVGGCLKPRHFSSLSVCHITSFFFPFVKL